MSTTATVRPPLAAWRERSSPSVPENTPARYLAGQLAAVETSMPLGVAGQVQAITGMTIEATDLTLPLGSLCRITSFGGRTSTAEVIGFRQDRTLLLPLTSTAGVARGDRVENLTASPRIWCSEQLLGRVINGLGEPIDGKGPLRVTDSRRIDNSSPAPMDRTNIRQPIATSVRSIDGLHTCGLGQRMGIFSGPGVGKSTLLSQIARFTSADVSVIALIGERGREVNEFIERDLGAEAMKRTVAIVATSDQPAVARVQAAQTATAVAEYFRDCGKDVLLMMDSLTRFAMAQREIGLAAGEPPTTRGYPPSMFALMPRLVERAGRTSRGSITGFYTVLVEGDDMNEPVSDTVRGLLDGHIILSRDLASRGHYPAIDVLGSISRVMPDVSPAQHMEHVRALRRTMATYREHADLISIGAYQRGSNPQVDLAIDRKEEIDALLRQNVRDAADVKTARDVVAALAARCVAAKASK